MTILLSLILALLALICLSSIILSGNISREDEDKS